MNSICSKTKHTFLPSDGWNDASQRPLLYVIFTKCGTLVVQIPNFVVIIRHIWDIKRRSKRSLGRLWARKKNVGLSESMWSWWLGNADMSTWTWQLGSCGFQHFGKVDLATSWGQLGRIIKEKNSKWTWETRY